MSEVIGYNVNGKIVDTQSYTGGGSEIKFDNSKEALEIIRHPWFVSAFLAGALAQMVKMLLAWRRTRKVSAYTFMSCRKSTRPSAI